MKLRLTTPPESDPVVIFHDGPLTVWHAPGEEPVIHMDVRAHSLSPEAVAGLWHALLRTRTGQQLPCHPLAIVRKIVPGEPGSDTADVL